MQDVSNIIILLLYSMILVIDHILHNTWHDNRQTYTWGYFIFTKT